MEALFIYLVKSSGLIALFYFGYYFLLRQETFFNSNRWFLQMGLFTALLLPLAVFTKTVIVEASTNTIDWSKIPVATSTNNQEFEINWYLILLLIYCLGAFLFLAKFVSDFYSLNSILKGKTMHTQADYKFIDTTENVAPFSYFNTIVYNSSLYSTSELENILEHERVHCEQKHSVDVLISRVFCILFWFNPLIWLYKKTILQNLEFIADSEATKKISDKKAYQFTLLKITTHENCVAITNHFYQSLIKKRIVMLNKNQSDKRNSWKYVLVLPALVAFMFLFQIKVIAQEKIDGIKEIESIKGDLTTVDIYQINKNTTDKELEENALNINTNYGIKTTFSKVKRNSSSELVAIRVVLKKGKEISKVMEIQETNAIKTFGIVVSKNVKGFLQIDFTMEDNINNEVQTGIVAPDAPLTDEKEIFINGKKANQSDLDKINPNDIITIDVNKNTDKSTIRIITKTDKNIILFDPKIPAIELGLDKTDPTNLNGLHKPKGTYTVKSVTTQKNGVPTDTEYFIDEKKVLAIEAESMIPDLISSMDVRKDANSNKNSIRIITKNYVSTKGNIPEPPMPPTPPTFSLKAPKAPIFPKAPIAPKGYLKNGDKKAWASFNKKMEDFSKKMEAMAPQIEAFDKKMADFDKQMKPFNAQMEIFEQKMRIYEKQIQE
ncbi:Signal transducer regulating beta-lactamase production, contains metallopeptidase domain [Flavobacterium micromati]|uniref:Signal transducer regulating beta-lactamase production, contains metallopeptidase domain n=1 Tax=Flavobacterium micromati TaxID=229205 RepID=A0A1M5MSD0_9FLAO|nr:M56 family metallopeptidase [Flavobacterium micromati]SHG79819.1 Signal transducer regulating beta-lactamase production, contains metallopeptidase domain [Flavobacterium micromati]